MLKKSSISMPQHLTPPLLVSTHEPRVWQTREVTLAQAVAERAWLWFP